jgi:hypothetical protein
VSEKEKDSLLPCSTMARRRVPRRAHVGQWRPVVCGDHQVTGRDVARVRAGDRRGRLSGVSG